MKKEEVEKLKNEGYRRKKKYNIGNLWIRKEKKKKNKEVRKT